MCRINCFIISTVFLIMLEVLGVACLSKAYAGEQVVDSSDSNVSIKAYSSSNNEGSGVITLQSREVVTTSGGSVADVGTVTVTHSDVDIIGADLNVNNNLNVTGSSMLGSTSITGQTSINTAAGATTSIGHSAGINTIIGTSSFTGATTLTGQTSINTAAGATTSIGHSAGTNTIIGTSTLTGVTTLTGETNINIVAGETTNIGHVDGENNVLGETYLNQDSSNDTNINSGNGTGRVMIGGNSNETHLNSATNYIGSSNVYSTTNVIGNTQNDTSVNLRAGVGKVSVADEQADFLVGSNGLSTYKAAQTLSTDASTLATQLKGVGDEASRALIAGESYVNRLEGDTLINGNAYVNGSLYYNSNESAMVSVTSGGSEMDNASQATKGGMIIKNSDGASIGVNGKLSDSGASGATASLTLTNGIGNTHGLVVTESLATLSGGTHSTSLTLHDNGATFSNAENGNPVTVTGIADGQSDFDAVNVRQLSGAVASVAAMANVPPVGSHKRFSLGVGVGKYMDDHALALSSTLRLSESVSLKASMASNFSKSREEARESTYGLGASVSW